MPIAYCIKQWPLGEWPTRCLARQATYYIYSDQIKINRGWPIGLTDCNYDHIQGFIKGEITPEEIGAYMQGEGHQGYTGLHNYLQMSKKFL